MSSVCFVLAVLWSTSALAAKRVLMMVPDDFMWPEYAFPAEAYRKAGFEVVTAGLLPDVLPDRRNTTRTAALYAAEARPLHVDLAFDKVDVTQYDAITFVAGNGAWHDFFPNDTVHKIVLATLEHKKVLGLLCASTGLIGLAGNYDGAHPRVAVGKRVVGYYRVEGLVPQLGKALLVPGGHSEPGVAVDGLLVTGRNPESARAFGDKIVDVLTGRAQR